jgi:pimeloyl-ACP methyl ester carboxylesterase
VPAPGFGPLIDQPYPAVVSTQAYASVNSLQMYYEVHGTGPPLVLVHGGALTIGLSFGPMIPALAQTHRVIAVEMQGHGHTAQIDREMTPANLADDIVSLLGQLGIEQTDLWGYSLGGCVSLEIVTRHPNLVRRLVLASTPTCRSDFALDGQLADDKMPTGADAQEWEAEYRRVAPHPDGFADLIARAAAMVGAIEDWSPDDLRAIQAPTLILIGDKDFITIEQAARTLDLIPDAQLAILPGATHVEVTRRPHQVLAMINPFLDGQP